MVLGLTVWIVSVALVSWLHHRETARLESQSKAWLVATHLRMDAQERHLAKLSTAVGDLEKRGKHARPDPRGTGV